MFCYILPFSDNLDTWTVEWWEHCVQPVPCVRRKPIRTGQVESSNHQRWRHQGLLCSVLWISGISDMTGVKTNVLYNGDPRSTGKNAHSVAGVWGILSFCMLRESLSKTFDLAFPDAKHQDAVHLCPFYFLLTLSGFMWFAPFACLCNFVDTSGCLRNQRDQTCWHHCRWNSEMSLAVMVPKRSWWKWWISWKTPPGLRLS